MMRIEENTSLSVKMDVIEIGPRTKKSLGGFVNYEDMSVGEFQLHVACLGWSRHSGTNLRLRKV